MTSPISVSVVVPTLGHVELVDRLLTSLHLASESYSGDVELIVSDASDEPDASQMRFLASSRGARLVTGPRGVSAQRNAGSNAARHEVLLFIDSDCEARPGLFDRIAEALRDPQTVAVAGRVRFEGTESAVFRAVRRTGVLDAFEGFGGGEFVPWGVTANFAVRKAAFTDVGRFDESFVAPGGEDVDLGMRLCRTGGKIRYQPQAVVVHPVEPWATVPRMSRRFFSYGRADVRLMRKYPEIVTPDGPGLLTGWLAVLGASMLWAASRRNPWMLLVPVLWPVLALALEMTLAAVAGRSAALSAGALLLVQCLDAGRLWEAVLTGTPRLGFSRVTLDEGQAPREWPAVLSTWIAATAATILLLIVSAMR